MRTWPDPNDAMIHQHLRQLKLRPSSYRTYHPMLVEFQQFVVQNSPQPGVSRELFESWLRHRAGFSPAHTIIQRVWPINRFLDWLVANRLLASNPLAEIGKNLGTRDAAQIVRALLSPDSVTALEALRPPPRFASHLGPAMQNHVTLMRSLGLRYRTQELQLLRFDRFLQKRVDLVQLPITSLVLEWGNEDSRPQHLVECVQTGRIVAKAMRRTDPDVVIPRFDHHLFRQARQQQRRPYIYSEEEVLLLLKTALSFPSPSTPLRPLILHTMLILAYCLGLRIGEIVRLTVGDIHLDDQTVEIRETKFFKSRRLPVTSTVMATMREYLEARDRGGAPAEQSAPLFWQWKTSGQYRYPTVGALLVQVIRRAGLKPVPGCVGPRIHDLRHSFVVHRIMAWYREGINPQMRLPFLSTYLGHRDLDSTLVYVTITQELLQQAGDRFRSFGARALEVTVGGDPCK